MLHFSNVKARNRKWPDVVTPRPDITSRFAYTFPYPIRKQQRFLDRCAYASLVGKPINYVDEILVNFFRRITSWILDLLSLNKMICNSSYLFNNSSLIVLIQY